MRSSVRHPLHAVLLLLLGAVGVSGTARAEGSEGRRAVSVKVETEDGAAYQLKLVSGLELDIEVIEVREGSAPTVRKVPGHVKYPDLVLTGALATNNAFFQWIEATGKGQFVRKNLFLTLFDGRDRPVARYRLINCWPSKWKVSPEEARPGEVLMETITLTLEGFERI